MTIYLQRSAPIQPRTSLGKSDVRARLVPPQLSCRGASRRGAQPAPKRRAGALPGLLPNWFHLHDVMNIPISLFCRVFVFWSQVADDGLNMPPGSAEDDRVLPKSKNPYFLENYFAIFCIPPYSECVKINEISNILHNFRKIVEIPKIFHQNQYEKHRI